MRRALIKAAENENKDAVTTLVAEMNPIDINFEDLLINAAENNNTDLINILAAAAPDDSDE